MHFFKKATFIVFAAFVVAGTASAEQTLGASAKKAQVELQTRFKSADSNGDGKLTKDEARSHMPFVYRNYARIDSDAKGSITLDQIESFVAKKP
ncbi:MAG: EF-hand domain-containing protein [Pseudomonas sp.]|uniref:EF-hand domain-containing protein n=1 Tax=Pseudomonas sp. TaxID=306 RepID=UPI003BB6973E